MSGCAGGFVVGIHFQWVVGRKGRVALLQAVLAVVVLASGVSAQQATQQSAQPLPNAPSAQKAAVKKEQASDAGWPRTFTSGTDTFLIYQPQVDKWDGQPY